MCEKCNGKHQRALNGNRLKFLGDFIQDVKGLGKVKKVIKIMSTEDKALIEEARQKMEQLFDSNEKLSRSR